MPKQIKLGFDKVISPQGTYREPLYDILTGEPLTSATDLPLKTIVERPVPQFSAARNSTSIVVNNKPAFSEGRSLKVEEQFPEVSQVSNTLLGVPRAETQLSLFSDVSSYGLDTENWALETATQLDLSRNNLWNFRSHPLYGPRDVGKLIEYTNEQALAIRAFPVAYSFPYGPAYKAAGVYQPELFSQYINFIAAGRILHRLYTSEGYGEFADAFFLPDYVKIVNVENEELTTYTINSEGNFLGLGTAHDVEYIPAGETTSEEVFNQIEKWTLTWFDLLNNDVRWPDADLQKDANVRSIIDGILKAQFDIRPGYYDNLTSYAKLTSKKTFRYQPGRISGFTFGARLKTDTASQDIAVEWGISNETDEYTFQLQGADFNIVRRSRVKLSDDLIERMGLDPQAQKEIVQKPGYNDGISVWELKVPRDLFNGDSLTGNGPSGYSADFENVTMWKIEFGWYGAIGAKFYAYIPVGNDQCRWVLVHTMVIENGIDAPCLVNPNFRFKYLLDIKNTSRLSQPVFAYKYGSSTYIDGGDEGTFRVFSTRSELKEFNDNSSILALFPKRYIINRDNLGIINEQKAYPTELVVTSSEDAVIKFKRIEGSPEGFHHHYSPSLASGRSPATKDMTVQISQDRQTVSIIGDPNQTFVEPKSKLIGDGLYNIYVDNIDEQTQSEGTIYRRDGVYQLVERPISDRIVNRGDSFTDYFNPAGRAFRVKNVGYKNIASSNFPINSTLFKIHFLNPGVTDPATGGSHTADFAICLSPERPKLVNVQDPDIQNDLELGVDAPQNASDVLRFGDEKSKFNVENFAYLEWSTILENLDIRSSAEYKEYFNFIGQIFDYDEEGYLVIPNEEGDGGTLAGVVGEIRTLTYFPIGFTTNEGNTQTLTFSSLALAPPITREQAQKGESELGFEGEPSGIYFITAPYEEVIDDEGNTVWRIDIDISSQADGAYDAMRSRGTIDVRAIEISDNYNFKARNPNGTLKGSTASIKQLFIGPWNILPVYLTVAMRDGASINNIVVEEITATGSTSHTPQWLSTSVSYEVDSDGFMDESKPVTTVQFTKGATLEGQPASFNSISDLSSLESDTQLTQPLRKGDDIFTTFCGKGETLSIDLSKIFGSDRYALFPNKYNTSALFVTAETFKSSDINGEITTSPVGEIQMTLTVKEQA